MAQMLNKTIDVIIPIYNEKENLANTITYTRKVLDRHFLKICFILVDDGSTDGTEKEVCKLEKNHREVMFKYIRLAKNYGKDLALKCGIDHSTADICAMLDADLQHPPEKILEAAEILNQGYNIVHILKKEYNFGSPYRKIGSFLFRQLISMLSEFELNLTDFKVVDKKAIDRIKGFKESFYYSSWIVELVGLKATTIEYEPNERKHGKSKFTPGALIKLSIHGIMSISIKPLRISIYTGFIISISSLIYGSFILFEKLFFGQPIPGFATLATAMFFLGGIQLLFLGILGEYLGKTFIETKRRPQYLIDYINEV